MGNKIKLIIGFLLGIVTYFLMVSFEVDPLIARTAGVVVLMAFWWITEATHLSITALLPIILFPLLGILPMKEVSRQYMNPIIFLFVGGFVLAFAMEKWNLHKRIALSIIARMGQTPDKLLFSFMASSFLLSMVILNTTTVIMLLPATLAIIKEIKIQNKKAFGEAILLGLAYAANIGGMATLIGTAPNLFFADFFSENYPSLKGFDFASWFFQMAPLAVILFLFTFLLLKNNYFFNSDKKIETDSIRTELEALGPIKRSEKVVAGTFILAIVLWILRPQLNELIIHLFEVEGKFLHDGMIAILLAALLYFIPVKGSNDTIITWKEFEKIPFGVLLLFGGGFALALAISKSGLGALIAHQMGFLQEYPQWAIILILCVFMTFFTEVTSNTASTQLMLPILAALILEFDWAPESILLAITLSASCAFMLPVATPPNTIVFGSGEVKSMSMARVGLILNIVCAIIIAIYLNLLY